MSGTMDVVKRWRCRVVAFGVAVTALAGAVGCGGDGSSSDEAAPVIAEGSAMLPHDTLRDVVSYSEALVVMTVSSEELVPALPDDPEGIVGRNVTVRVDDVLWTRPGAREVPRQFTMATDGWALIEGKQRPFVPREGPRLEVGSTYVAPLSQYEANLWAPLMDSVVSGIEGERLKLGRAAHGPFRPFDGHPVSRLTEALDGTSPDPATVRYSSLTSLERFQAAYPVSDGEK